MRKFAVGEIHWGNRRINTSELHRIAICQSIHSLLGQIDTLRGVIDGRDIDGLAIVSNTQALAARGAVVARNVLPATDIREVGNLALVLVSVASDDTVDAIRASNDVEGAGCIVVARVVRDGDG